MTIAIAVGVLQHADVVIEVIAKPSAIVSNVAIHVIVQYVQKLFFITLIRSNLPLPILKAEDL
jgi:hypothetical protein